jgi:hypothetical protein
MTKPLTRPDNCPHCGASLLGGEIPEHINQPFQFSDGTWHKPYGDATHWRREIGVEVQGGYDGVLYYECPDCHDTWNRWPDEPYWKKLYDAAEREMAKARANRVHHKSMGFWTSSPTTDDWDKVTCAACRIRKAHGP